MLERISGAAGSKSEPPASAGGTDIRATSHADTTPQTAAATPPAYAGGSDKSTPALKRALNAHGREIFIEKTAPNGKPDIWHDHDSKGRKRRMVRRGNAVMIERV